MVVKNTEKAKDYLDLTDGEYEKVKEISAAFTMAKLSYHASLLENALSDMQRASNAKRSIAEISLTRMCDSKNSSSAEALIARIEELEKQSAMLKMGVPMTNAQPMQTAAVEQKPKQSELVRTPEEEASRQEGKPQSNDAPAPYGKWNAVLERIAEIKKPLSSQFFGAKAIKISESSFVIEMSGFFAERIKSSSADMAILKGVIAEKEQKQPSEITVDIKAKGADSQNSFSNDLDNI